jgi:flagellar M-ring protein FliF
MIVPFRQQLSDFWKHQSNSRRISLIALGIALAILVPVIISWATTPSYAVAFSGLSETDAGEVIQKLTDSGISYKIEGGTTILVPSNQVYEVRLQMAKNGLPKSSSVGFELFNNSTLGMTDFTQKVNYQRALEGELEKTIGSLDSVEAVKVHIVTPEKSLLTANQDPTTASVTLKVRSGRQLEQSQVMAITHLVSSSVESLKPENVVVVDTQGNMLASGTTDDQGLAGAQLDSQRTAEAAAAISIQKKVQGLLDSVLGPNRSVVQASVSMDWTQKEITSQTYNPTQVAISSSQKTNETSTSGGTNVGGVPGAASNLPTPVPTVTAGSTASTYTKTDETINYEVSQVQSHEINPAGQIKRVTLSVMVDGVTDQTQLDTIKNAVTAAAGIDQNRGDVLSVTSLAFDRSYYQSETADLTKQTQTDLYWKIGEIAGAVIVVVFLLFYISRLFRNLKLASSDTWVTVMKPIAEAALPHSSGSMLAANAGASGGFVNNQNQNESQQKTKREIPVKAQSPVNSVEDEQMQRVLTRMTEESPATVAEIIQLWLNEDGK